MVLYGKYSLWGSSCHWKAFIGNMIEIWWKHTFPLDVWVIAGCDCYNKWKWKMLHVSICASDYAEHGKIPLVRWRHKMIYFSQPYHQSHCVVRTCFILTHFPYILLMHISNFYCSLGVKNCEEEQNAILLFVDFQIYRLICWKALEVYHIYSKHTRSIRGLARFFFSTDTFCLECLLREASSWICKNSPP